MPKYELIATCLAGLESQVAWELKSLGYEDQVTEHGRVRFRGDASAIARSNLWLRVADRIQLVVGEFHAPTFDALYDGVRALPWGEYIPFDGAIPVDGKSVKSLLTSVPAVQGMVKKAIVDSLAARHRVNVLPERGASYRVQVSILENRATLTIDMTGEGLHKRGYRDLSAAAPIKETLGAGIMTLSRWRGDRPFADPCCGSGTIPIEAALYALDAAPGLQRKFDSEEYGFIPTEAWRDARIEARDRFRRGMVLDIQGSDIDPQAIGLAERHARRAGVQNYVRFNVAPASAFAPEGEYGTVVTNPPYGERIGEMHDVEQLYRDLGEAYRRMPTWSWNVFTGLETFERFFDRAATKKRKLYNGKLRCDLYQYQGPRPPRPQREATSPD